MVFHREYYASMSDPLPETEKYSAATMPGNDPVRHELLIPSVLSLVGDISGRSVADVGCGPGMFLSHLLRRRPQRFVACDASAEMLSIIASHFPGVERMFLDISRVPLPLGEFSLVICVMVVHLIRDMGRCVRHMAAGLEPGGRLILCVPHPCFHFQQAQIDAWSSQDMLNNGPTYHLEGELQNCFGRPRIEAHMFHRPVSHYVKAVLDSGLTLTTLREPGEYAMLPWAHIPAFLLIEGTKP